MGCSQTRGRLVVPTGYSFNLDALPSIFPWATIFLAQLYNVQLTTGEMLTILGILMVTSTRGRRHGLVYRGFYFNSHS